MEALFKLMLLSIAFNVPGLVVVKNLPKLPEATTSVTENNTRRQEHVCNYQCPLLFKHVNLPSQSSSSMVSDRKTDMKNGKIVAKDGSIFHEMDKKTGNERQDSVDTLGQITPKGNESTRQMEETSDRKLDKRKFKLARDKIIQNNKGVFRMVNIRNDGLGQDRSEPEVSNSVLRSNYDDDDDDAMMRRTWEIPPIDYYKCGRCVCHNSQDVHALYADCQNRNLRAVPDNLNENTTDVNLYENRVTLALDKLSRYTSLATLNVSGNSIIRLPNCSSNDTSGLHTLDLSDNDIITIHSNMFWCLPHLKKLLLQNNYIQTVANGMLQGLHKLQHLDLSQNYISAIEHSSFIQCSGLKSLNLSKNKNMTYGVKQFNAAIFKPLKNLETLYIHGFSSSTGILYPTAALLELKNLRRLSIDGVLAGRFEPKLSALTNMTDLMIGVDGHCGIKSLVQGYFSGFPNLKSVHISECKPSKISPLAFEANTNLVSLKYTKMAYVFEELFDSLSGLQNSSLKSLTINLVRKYAKRTACRQLGRDQAKYIKNMHQLQELNLENNLVSLIQYDFLINLPISLRKLSLSKNTLHYLRSVIKNSAIARLVNLEEVKEDLQNNVVFFQNQEYEDSCDSIKDEENAETGVVQVLNPEMTKPSPVCSSYSTDHNDPPDTLTLPMPPNLRVYSAAQSFHFGEMLISQKTEINKLRYFDVSNSYMTDWGTKFLSPLIEAADFSDNFCDSLKVSFFRANNSLRELNAAGNFLGESFAQDVRGEILSRLQNVRYLDFSRNHIQHLPFAFLSGLRNVEVINLSGNNILTFHVNLSSLSKVTFLNLSTNSISVISRQSLDDLDKINTHHQVSLDLTSNPLSCSCTGLRLIQWLATTNVRILNRDFLKCVNENNEMELLGNLQQRFPNLQKKCVSKEFLILIASFSLTFILAITLTVWLFRNRWRLHYLRNIAIARFFGYKRQNDEEEIPFTYDAYIMYSKHDSGFAMGECLRELEATRGHKLCVEDRNFLLGTFMSCTVTSAICSSRLTIPLISPDFLASEWCQYGVQMAVMESLHSERDVLHLLIYKPVPVDEMPRHLIKVLKENAFCEFPPDGCDDNVRQAFWDNLSRTIGHIQRRDAPDKIE